MVITKNRAYGLLVLGIAAVVLGFAIDPLRGYDIHLHWTQILAIVAGIIAILIGAYFVWIKKPLA